MLHFVKRGLGMLKTPFTFGERVGGVAFGWLEWGCFATRICLNFWPNSKALAPLSFLFKWFLSPARSGEIYLLQRR